jgi:hypothetical protein
MEISDKNLLKNTPRKEQNGQKSKMSWKQFDFIQFIIYMPNLLVSQHELEYY